MSGNLIVAFALFLVSVAVAVGLSLFVLTVVLRMQQKHRKRLARVGRRRMSGRLDLEDARLTLLKQKQEKNAIVTLTDALAKFIPLLDTTRLRANFRRADNQVERHPIASRSRLPRPKYSARGVKCGRRWLDSKRPDRLPSEFSPS
jgi:hypothetical protein